MTAKPSKKLTALIISVIFACAVMAFIDGVISPTYAVKSAFKIALFGTVPILYVIFSKDRSLVKVFSPTKGGIFLALALGAAVYVIIVGGYLLLRDVFDFSSVTASLTSGEGVTKDNFIYVAIYISLCNSLLEEFFFRGFAFGEIKKNSSRKFAYIFSAAAFSLYHVAFMIGWFDFFLFILLMAGLFIGGVIFNFLDEKTGCIYPSWIFHMFSNLATNTVGLILFNQM